MVALGCDHGGIILMKRVMEAFDKKGIAYKNFGSFGEATDYPDIALPVCKSVASGESEKGILICGTGIGMSIAANKVHGVRAAVCSEHFSMRYTRMHNDTNVLCLGARVTGDELALELIDLFLNTEFEGGRHARRVDKIMEIEQTQTLSGK